MKKSLITTAAVIASLLVTGAAFAGGAPTIEIHQLVVEGMNVAGVGDISSGFGASENHAVNNDGEWLVESDTNNANTDEDGVVLRGTGFAPGALFLRENQAMGSPAGSNLDSFDSININNLGNTSFNHFLDNTGATNNDSGIYFNSDLLIQESNTVTAAGISANSPWLGFFETKLNNSNTVMVMGTCDDPAIASSVDQLIVLVNPISLEQTLVVREGSEIVPGRFLTTVETGPHDFALNDDGHVLFAVTMDGDAANNTGVVLWDGNDYTFLAREGSSSPVAARNWASLPGAISMNNSGDWVMIGDLDGSTSDDSLIVKNGTEVIAREGFGVADIGAFTFTTFGTGAVHIDDAGNVIWVGDWNDPDTSKDVGIFWNEHLIVQEGVTQIDGVTLASISLVQDNMSISDNGEWLIFEGVLANGIDGAFMVRIPEPGTLLLACSGCLLLFRRRFAGRRNAA